MPRDLELEKVIAGMPPLAKDKPAEQDSEPGISSSPENYDPMPLYRLPSTLLEERFRRLKDLHPYALLLSQDDVDECDWLEHVAFEPHEAATREKVRCCPRVAVIPPHTDPPRPARIPPAYQRRPLQRHLHVGLRNLAREAGRAGPQPRIPPQRCHRRGPAARSDRKSTRLNSSHWE